MAASPIESIYVFAVVAVFLGTICIIARRILGTGKSAGLNGGRNAVHAPHFTPTVLARELAEMAGRIGLRPLNSVIHRRQVYQHSALLGWKALNSEAREEILKAALEIAALSSM